ncbi:MAG: hypothetical protein ACI4J4_05365 [Ruminiclostridium sp.]
MKLKRKLLLPLFAIAISFLLSGCVNRPFADLQLSWALTKRYGDIFIVADSFVSSGNWLNAGPLEAVCYPLSDKKLNFKATYSYKNNQLYGEEYAEAVVREEAYAEMEQILSQYYTDFILDADASHSIIQLDEMSKYKRFTNIKDVSIASYEEKYGEKMIISFYIGFNTEEIENYEEAEPIFKEYCKKFTDGRVNFFCYYMNSEDIDKCKKLEETDYWEHYNSSDLINKSENRTEYVYRYMEKKFFLSSIISNDGVQRFNSDGTPITESKE